MVSPTSKLSFGLTFSSRSFICASMLSTSDFRNEIAHLFGLDTLQNILAHLVFLTGKHVHDVPLIFCCECLSHKSVQPGEEVHHVHQNKIEQRHVSTQQ